MTTMPPSVPVQTQPSFVGEPRPCIRCSYDLRGLPATGVCPECSTPVADSLKGFLLQYAAPEYITTVRSGHSLVLNGILLSIVVTIGSAILGAVLAAPAGAGAPPLMQVQLLSSLVMLGVYVMVFLGYVKATEADPAFVGIEKPDAARNVVRITVMSQMAIQLLTVVFTFMIFQGSTLVISLPLGVLMLVLSLIGSVLWAVQFFAMMRYTRWLGTRVPDAFIIRRTKTYMWLLPVLATVGIILVGLGPLIALVLYWNLLDRMRKHLKAIEATGEPAILPKMAG